MIRTSTVLIIIILIVLAGAGAWYYLAPQQAPQAGNETPAGSISAEENASIRALVTDFGTHLKNVSLLSTSTLSSQLQAEYGNYLSPDLLNAWQADPSLALGREVSSPWPDRIDVGSVTANGDGTYLVTGNIVEVTSTDTATSSATRVPVTLTVSRGAAGYVIVAASAGASSTQEMMH